MKPQDRTIAVNDIEPFIRIEVKNRKQFLETLRGMHHCKDAVEITLKGTNLKYYVCSMNEFNALGRKRVLSRAAGLLQRISPEQFLERIQGDTIIQKNIFWGVKERGG